MKLTPLKNTDPNTAANPSPIREKFPSSHIPIPPPNNIPHFIEKTILPIS